MRVHRAACLTLSNPHLYEMDPPMKSLPTEAEITSAAERLGHLRDDGTYPPQLRKKLAAFVVEEAEELAKVDASQPDGTTVNQLSRLYTELRDEEFTDAVACALVAAIAPALVRRQGLHLKGTRTA